MEYLENRLVITFPEMVSCGVSESYLKKALSLQRKGKLTCWEHTKKGKEIFIYYDGLNDKYKVEINSKFFDGIPQVQLTENKSIQLPQIITNNFNSVQTPFNYNKRRAEKFESHLSRKQTDIDFIQTYKVGGKLLNYPTIRGYIEACSVLELIGKMSVKQIKQIGYKNCKEFFDAAICHINNNNLPLPTSEARLRSKANLYIENGAISVISKRFGKANNVKVGKVQNAVILELIGKHNQFDSSIIAKIFNNEALKQGWDTISSRTVSNIFAKNKLQITGSRNGIAAFRNSFDHTIKRQRPSAPNLLWVGDGWDFELFYQKRTTKKNGNTKVSYSERKKVYFVIDAFNDYILGYAIGDTENIEFTKLAWKDACIKHCVLPYQIKSDNFAKAQLAPFYEQLCYKTEFYTPSAIGNARDKPIERMFGQFYNEVVRMYPNASGRNITAKEQPNRDVLNSIKNSFPDESEVIKQIETCINTWNTLAREKHEGLSKEQFYLQGDHTRDRKLTDFQKLNFFGTLRKRSVTYTKEGLVLTIDGNTITYRDWSNKELMDSIGIEFQVIYEPSDLSKILIVSDEGRIKHLIQQERLQPMALMDMQKGDRIQLNERLKEKQRNIQENVIDKANERRNTLKEANINIPLLNENSSEGMYKLMPIVSGRQKGNIEQSENDLKVINTGFEDNANRTIKPHYTIFDSEINEEYKIAK